MIATANDSQHAALYGSHLNGDDVIPLGITFDPLTSQFRMPAGSDEHTIGTKFTDMISPDNGELKLIFVDFDVLARLTVTALLKAVRSDQPDVLEDPGYHFLTNCNQALRRDAPNVYAEHIVYFLA